MRWEHLQAAIRAIELAGDSSDPVKVARGIDLLEKTLSIGHAAGAPASLTGGAALVAESFGGDLKVAKKKLKKIRALIEKQCQPKP